MNSEFKNYDFNELNILLPSAQAQQLQNVINKINLLQAHLPGIGRDEITINIKNVETLNQNNLLEVVSKENIDIVIDLASNYDDIFIYKHFYKVEILKTINELRSSIESFLLGNNIAFDLSNPVFKMDLTDYYIARQGLNIAFYNFMAACEKSGHYSEDKIDRIRHIVNKINQIHYSKDLLDYYTKRFRKAKRLNSRSHNLFSIEINYHLSNYYFLLAGTLDSMARLLNSFFELKLRKYKDLALEKESFIQANKDKQTGIGQVLENTESKEWILFLKKRRNFIAHEGAMQTTSLIKEKDKPLGDNEIRQQVDKKINSLKISIPMMTDEEISSFRNDYFGLEKYKANYEEILPEIISMPSKDKALIWRPLFNIEYDYNQFSNLMKKILSKLNDQLSNFKIHK